MSKVPYIILVMILCEILTCSPTTGIELISTHHLAPNITQNKSLNASIASLDFMHVLNEGFRKVFQQDPRARVYHVIALDDLAESVMTTGELVNIGINFKVGNQFWILDTDPEDAGVWLPPYQEEFEVPVDKAFKISDLRLSANDALGHLRGLGLNDPFTSLKIHYASVSGVQGLPLVYYFEFEPAYHPQDYDVMVDAHTGAVHFVYTTATEPLPS